MSNPPVPVELHTSDTFCLAYAAFREEATNSVIVDFVAGLKKLARDSRPEGSSQDVGTWGDTFTFQFHARYAIRYQLATDRDAGKKPILVHIRLLTIVSVG